MSIQLSIAACVASLTASKSRPLMMISMIEFTPSGTPEASPNFCFSVGQNFSYVLANRNEYLLPAFDADAATPLERS